MSEISKDVDNARSHKKHCNCDKNRLFQVSLWIPQNLIWSQNKRKFLSDRQSLSDNDTTSKNIHKKRYSRRHEITRSLPDEAHLKLKEIMIKKKI